MTTCVLRAVLLPQVVHALAGMPAWGDGLAAPAPRLLPPDMLGWAVVTGLFHVVATARLLRDERPVAFTEEEERAWRLFYRRSGMERLEFREVVRRGAFESFAPGAVILAPDAPLQRLCLLVEGLVEINATYRSSLAAAARS